MTREEVTQVYFRVSDSDLAEEVLRYQTGDPYFTMLQSEARLAIRRLLDYLDQQEEEYRYTENVEAIYRD